MRFEADAIGVERTLVRGALLIRLVMSYADLRLPGGATDEGTIIRCQ